MSQPAPAERVTPRVADVVEAMDALYPPQWACTWDSVGLICGDPQAAVQRVLFALDPVEVVVDEALAAGAQMIITHHPLFLRGTSSVAATTPKGRLIHRLIKADVALFNAHTNADAAPAGVNDTLADLLGVGQVQPLEAVEHPDAPAAAGLGRMGTLQQPSTLRAFAEHVARVLPHAPVGIRVSGPLDALVRRVAVCSGAGDSLLATVAARQADVYVTADLRHHPASEATGDRTAAGPALIDAGHWATESPWLAVAAQALGAQLAVHGLSVHTTVSSTPTDPWAQVLPTGPTA